MIRVVTCACGSADLLVREFLKSVKYPDWMGIDIAKGREKSLSVLNQIPPSVEKENLRNFLKEASKWAVIIGYGHDDMRWSDISHNGPKSRIEAEFIVRKFEFD